MPITLLMLFMVLDFMYMPRVAITIFADLPHQITQRGIGHEPVFFNDDDRNLYSVGLKSTVK